MARKLLRPKAAQFDVWLSRLADLQEGRSCGQCVSALLNLTNSETILRIRYGRQFRR
jgi:hypothetical protein